MRSFYKFNEKSREDEIISELHAGKNIALISDAGTPGISDPGTQLIKRCHLEKIPVTATPGACALIMALSLSSFNRTKFQFLGFAEKDNLKQALSYDGLSILYEAPHRLLKTLQFIADHDPNRKIGIARELTKLHEEFIEGTAPSLLTHFTTVKGECVILIDACPLNFTTLSEKEHVLWLQNEYDLSLSDAIRTTAQLRGIPKRDVYKAAIN
jgi:16S rRNA (cytidine1402-2'-O)-methyltransferase